MYFQATHISQFWSSACNSEKLYSHNDMELNPNDRAVQLARTMDNAHFHP
jgi:hypothetical protein